MNNTDYLVRFLHSYNEHLKLDTDMPARQQKIDDAGEGDLESIESIDAVKTINYPGNRRETEGANLMNEDEDGQNSLRQLSLIEKERMVVIVSMYFEYSNSYS